MKSLNKLGKSIKEASEAQIIYVQLKCICVFYFFVQRIKQKYIEYLLISLDIAVRA